MMFNNRFVLAIRAGGKILRENNAIVTLPFGSEYEIVLKNLNSRRALVSVSVDGKEATEGRRLVIGPNETCILERAINNGNLHSGNRFKFIERTAAVESHRGVKVDDGLVRAEFWAEKEVAVEETIIRRRFIDEYEEPYPKNPWPSAPRAPRGPRFRSSGNLGGMHTNSERGGIRSFAGDDSVIYGRAQGGSTIPGSSITGQSVNMNVGATADAGLEETELCRGANFQQTAVNALNDNGITVAGSASYQQFRSVAGFPVESASHVLVLQLKGDLGGVPVPVPITVDTKKMCPTCGKTNSSLHTFCSQCGTGLVIY